jgi:hypothetical protein
MGNGWTKTDPREKEAKKHPNALGPAPPQRLHGEALAHRGDYGSQVLAHYSVGESCTGAAVRRR